jgi:fructokinase
VRFVGAVGADLWGKKLITELALDGVDCSMVAQIAGARTPVTFITLCDEDRQFLSYRNGAADGQMGPELLDPRALHGASWLHLASSSLRTEPRASTTRVLVRRALHAGVRVSLDLNVRPGLWASSSTLRAAIDELCEVASLIKASDDDLRQLGITPTLSSLQALAPRARVVLTLAARGAVAAIDSKVIVVPAPSVEVSDTTGAGDAFVGALLAQLDLDAELWKADAPRWQSALERSCQVGALAVTRVGATSAIERLPR